MRFSLRWLLLAVAFIAFSVTALLNANPFWLWWVRSSLVVTLSVAVVLSIVAADATRWLWIGFAAVGWSFFLSGILDYYPPFSELNSDGMAKWIHSKIVRTYDYTEFQAAGKSYSGMPVTVTPTGQQVAFPQLPYVIAVYHCVLTVLFALVGGFIASWFYRRNKPFPERTTQ